MNFFLAMCVSLHSHATQVVNTDKIYFWTKYHIVCIFSIGEIFSDAKMVCIRTIFFIYLGSKNVIKKCIERSAYPTVLYAFYSDFCLPQIVSQ